MDVHIGRLRCRQVEERPAARTQVGAAVVVRLEKCEGKVLGESRRGCGPPWRGTVLCSSRRRRIVGRESLSPELALPTLPVTPKRVAGSSKQGRELARVECDFISECGGLETSTVDDHASTFKNI